MQHIIDAAPLDRLIPFSRQDRDRRRSDGTQQPRELLAEAAYALTLQIVQRPDRRATDEVIRRDWMPQQGHNACLARLLLKRWGLVVQLGPHRFRLLRRLGE